MSSQRSILGKWALYRRWEAHLTMPALFCAVIIALYFFTPVTVQRLISPGVVEIPFTDGRLLGVPHVAMALCLLWCLVLSMNILIMTQDRGVWFAAVLIIVIIVMSTLMWLDGHSLMSRTTELWGLASGAAGPPSGFLAEHQGLIGLAGFGLFTLLFFMIIPLVYGDTRNPVAHMLIPSRWLALTALVMFASFWLAFRLQGMGWGQFERGDGALAGDLSVFVKPVFVYMLLLYLARMQYLTWVRKEAQHWRPQQRYR
jgi:hypothetical protein